MTVIGIAAETLEVLTQVAANAHPNESISYLRATPIEDIDYDFTTATPTRTQPDTTASQTPDTPQHGSAVHEVSNPRLITDSLFIPGTQTGPTSATVQDWMAPSDTAVVGTAHSHPNGVISPSSADLDTFTSGSVHIIIGAPYTLEDWQAYTPDGTPFELPVYDPPLDDGDPAADFFDFTEEDLIEDVEAARKKRDEQSLLRRFLPW